MKKSNKILAVVMALVMMITAVPMMTAMAGDEHVHVYTKYGETVEPSCVTKGYTVYKCTCGDTKTSYTEALGHNLIGTYIETEDAHAKYCDRCKLQISEEHNWEDVKVTKEPTCTEAGTKTIKCTVCKYEVKDVPVAAKGHTVTTVATNDVTDATHKGVCTVCEKTVTVAHTWGEGVVTKAPKCVTAGEMTYTCTVCKKETKVNSEAGIGAIVVADKAAEDWEKIMPTHSYGNWTSANENTHKRECACGKTETTIHKFVVVEGAKSLCDDSVALTITCEDCNYKLETSAKEHDFAAVTKYDKDNHKQTCKDCKTSIVIAHDWVDVKVNKAATCKEAGEKEVKCACGETKTVEIPKLEEHTWDKGEVTKEANCGEKGEKTFKCTVCEATKTEEIATVGEHKWGKWEVTVIATPLTKGTKTRTCSVCGAKESEKFEYEEETDEFLTGDVNNDDKVTASDARLVLQNVANLREFTEAETKAADVNEDGKISAVDARMILQIVAGLKK